MSPYLTFKFYLINTRNFALGWKYEYMWISVLEFIYLLCKNFSMEY